MLLTISTTHQPATDLGYLLYKHPAKVQTLEISQGNIHIFYPEATEQKTTIALLLDIDPIGLVRNSKGPSGEGFALEHYVNDRPYVASSFMSVAIAKAFSTAMNGTCKDRPELVDEKLPLEVGISVLPARGGETFLRRLFEPLGYEVSLKAHELDSSFLEWGMSRYFTVNLKARLRLRDVLSHLYVLIPVLDNDKHYWIGEHEVEKLLEKGEGWLKTHPEQEQITRRYLKNLGALTRQAFAVLLPDEEITGEEQEELPEEVIEKRKTLHEQRLIVTLEQLLKSGAKRVLDLGCGEGKLLRLLLKEKQFEQILGMDVSYRSLEIAKDKLHLDRLPTKQQERIKLIQGSLLYKDKRLSGYDAAAIVEVIEHLDASRLTAFEKTVFAFARPQTVIITTPNIEYNRKYETLAAGTFRHSDHRFEWSRAEFKTWASNIASQYHYQVEFLPVGPEDAEVGTPSQMGVFTIN
ncbi:3' terminal RNA ribose 2'-O-methyltransferase Hen1 [Rhodocytophaga rosea]|uniref:Small RNA 2'-O-methyltransferase n=1 Tax=Rhodocytophaga rosea TaxID=2704465 RepID=A0A6C0GTQ5_9BACT|nr:3' terminal RNA ribose 2'-O-methyltransferase Hen1 [Rhodocytophaga rosea]QHT71545.1 3' terminal RNA ribose 2'-O-methyltransferase Hen1 [Rhodocytophaga rosea]